MLAYPGILSLTQTAAARGKREVHIRYTQVAGMLRHVGKFRHGQVSPTDVTPRRA
jgi:hypothetical protein